MYYLSGYFIFNFYLKSAVDAPGFDFRTDHLDVVDFPVSSEHCLLGDVFEHE